MIGILKHDMITYHIIVFQNYKMAIRNVGLVLFNLIWIVIYTDNLAEYEEFQMRL